jgi:cell division septation protein DedD
MGIANTAIMAGWLGVGAAVLASCGTGGGGLLNGEQASSLESQLDAVSSEVSNGQCAAAQATVAHLQTMLANYPSVNATLVLTLDQGFKEVARLAAVKCHQAALVSTLTTRTPPSHPKQTNTVSTASTPTSPPVTTTTTTATSSTSTTSTTPSTTQTTTNGGVGIGGGTGTGSVPGSTTTTTTPTPGSTGGAGSGNGGAGTGQ